MLDPVAFTLGPFTVRWYGIAYALGFLFVALVIYRTARRWKIDVDIDSLLTILLGAMIGVVLGARLGHVIFYGNGYYFSHPGQIFAFSNGGMSFHGGLIGALLSAIVTARLTKIPYCTIADLAVIGAPLGLFFGRVANFINGELWGKVTDLPWGVVFGGSAGSLPRHPSQLYEALLEGVILFIVLYSLSRKKPPLPRGSYLGIFLVLYGIFRILIEFIRVPEIQQGYLWGDWLTTGQVLSAPLVVIGIILLVWAHKKRLPQRGLPEGALQKKASKAD